MKTYKFIFEDNPDMSISRLISNCSYNGNNTFFSSGNTRIFETLLSLYNTDDLFCIFYDISPENRILITRYHSLIDNIRQMINDYNENVYIIPVICTEYAAIKMLSSYRYLSEDIDYDIDESMDYNLLRSRTKQRTLERVFKQLLRNLGAQYQNINEAESNDVDNKGEFYRTDNTKLKSEQLWTSLPVMHIVNNEHKKYLESEGIICNTQTIKEIINSTNSFFDSIFIKAGVNKVKFNILVSK